jgi:hypothetical protein
MKRFLITAAALALTATAADAGPLRCLAQRITNRVQARPNVRQAACDVRQVAQRVASVPGRVVQSQPVRTAVGNAVMAFGSVCGPNGCR